MALSRYRKSKILDNFRLETPKISFIYSNNDIYYYQVKSTDRLDILAKQDFGDESYWWILAKLNKIQFFFDLQPETQIKRPRNPGIFLNQI